MSKNLIIILGPTAVGKTKFSVQLAYEFNGEIISADSRQVYKYMDIGTGKDLSDYEIDGSFIPYHLINIIDPSEEYDLFKFRSDFITAYNDITGRKKTPFLVGGTGLYIHSLLNDYSLSAISFEGTRYEELNRMDIQKLVPLLKSISSKLHNTTDLLDRERTIRAILIAEAGEPDSNASSAHFDSLVLGINSNRDELKSKITERLKVRLKEGMVDEVKVLLEKGITHEKLNFFGLEYKFLSMYLKDDLNYNDMFQKLNSSIHKFAKRQMTWFRKMEKEGVKIHWLAPEEIEKAKSLVSDFLRANIN